MDSNNTSTFRSFDESLIRELPHLRIAPLREPVSSRNLQIPIPLEPNASGTRDPSTISKTGSSTGILPPRTEPGSASLEGANGARPKNDFTPESLLEPPPRPILPAFVNLRALERFPYSSFDDDSHQSRKRRRVDAMSEPFGETLQLPMPQAQKEQKPPPFGPFAILNGLNEPPPNAALLPPIEAGSITQLLTKPSRYSLDIESTLLNTSFDPDAPSGERIEGRIADLLDSPVVEKTNPYEDTSSNGKVESRLATEAQASQLQPQHQPQREIEIEPEPKPAEPQGESRPVEHVDAPLSPKTRGRSRRNIRRWTDEETVALLRGVLKYGIGNWKEILMQNESSFNQRSASNLKDRFRVCCPSAYRGSDSSEAIQTVYDALAEIVSRLEYKSSTKEARPIHPSIKLALPRPPGLTHSGSSSSFSSLETNHNSSENRSQSEAASESVQPEPKPSNRASASFVLPQPSIPAKLRRRSRRPFTAEEDEALLKGYSAHGFQWTVIQQDEQLNLGHRRATDLRDRFRTRFPHAYCDGGSVRGHALQALVVRDMILKDTGNGLPGSKQASSDGASGKPDGLTSGAHGTVDLPVASEGSTAGSSSTGVPFHLDENHTNNSSVDLAPLVWDDFS